MCTMRSRRRRPSLLTQSPLTRWLARSILILWDLHRAINLIVALILVAIGGGGFVYFNFIDATWPRWITIVAIIVGAAGVYWLWEEHANLGQQPRD
jgi:protein-S-isoprenylcysteine O-methyltransferase Ste14